MAMGKEPLFYVAGKSFGINYKYNDQGSCLTFQLFNWLSKDARFWGPYYSWYDGPWYSYGLWFTNFGWMECIGPRFLYRWLGFEKLEQEEHKND